MTGFGPRLGTLLGTHFGDVNVCHGVRSTGIDRMHRLAGITERRRRRRLTRLQPPGGRIRLSSGGWTSCRSS